mmetsp:Transcript_50810/g.127491  ORF Transcript_50810/g.127491 Transcript_50810/m.127491 type:complete len:240 (+) Transcript_50810:184-903(+)
MADRGVGDAVHLHVLDAQPSLTLVEQRGVDELALGHGHGDAPGKFHRVYEVLGGRLSNVSIWPIRRGVGESREQRMLVPQTKKRALQDHHLPAQDGQAQECAVTIAWCLQEGLHGRQECVDVLLEAPQPLGGLHIGANRGLRGIEVLLGGLVHTRSRFPWLLRSIVGHRGVERCLLLVSRWGEDPDLTHEEAVVFGVCGVGSLVCGEGHRVRTAGLVEGQRVQEGVEVGARHLQIHMAV